MPKFISLLTMQPLLINKRCWKGTVIMVTDFVLFAKRIWAKNSVCFLAFIWTFSVFAGIILGSKSVPYYTSLMLSAASGPMSIAGMFLIFILPLVISIISIRFKVSFLVLPLALIKGFFYGFLTVSVYSALGSAGWLICLLLLFSNSILIVLLLWFWFKYLKVHNCCLMRDFLVAIAFGVLVCAFDAIMVSPFLTDVILYF